MTFLLTAGPAAVDGVLFACQLGNFVGEVIFFLFDAFAKSEPHEARKFHRRTDIFFGLRHNFGDLRFIIDNIDLSGRIITFDRAPANGAVIVVEYIVAA